MTSCGAGAAPQLCATPARARPSWAFALLALAISACTTLAPPAPATGETLSGRLALRVDANGDAAAKAFSAAFDLRGDGSAGTLDLSTPLGSTLAKARWSPADVVLVTPQGTRRYANLDELTRDALGESVPIEAWFDWLRGRPWSGAPSEPVPGLQQGFAQLGWRVDLGNFAAEGALNATRTTPPPTVTVRIRLDRS
ncbi:MAG: outer membrane lipoprotein LolB [Rhizobacter sp.]|nr:outer membrane lipoprotein LolB [Rhizobacter sp.]